MTNQFATRRNQKNPTKRDFFAWIDSELRHKAPEVAGPAIRNTINLSDETEGVKAAQLQYLNQQIEFIRSSLALLQVTPDEPEAAPVAAIEAPAFDISKAETVEAPAPENVSNTNNLPPSYSVEIDPVLGQWAIIARLSVPFAQWAILRELARPNNYISRHEALAAIQNAHECTERNASQILRRGNGLFWDYDINTGRYYIRAEHKVAVRLAELIPYAIAKDNIPGNYRYRVDLQGSKERINAHIYAAWMYSKAEHRPGRLYHNHREQLCQQFNVSKVTLLRWEEIAGVKTRPQYERSADTSIENAPKHAYLRLGDDGKLFVEAQLPNAYYPPEHIKRAHRGSSSRTRDAVLEYLQTNEPDANGVQLVEKVSTSDTGLQKLRQQYFEGSADNWTTCDKHLRKHQDPFTPHWVGIAEDNRNGLSVGFFERFNPVTNEAPKMEGVKVDYRGEHADTFKARKLQWGMALVEAHL